MRRLFAVVLVPLLVALAACSGGNTANSRLVLGDSHHFSRSEVEAAAEVTLSDFRSLPGCSLEQLTYDEALSDAQAALDRSSTPTGDLIIFTADFRVDSRGGDGTLEPNSTQHWTWTLKRASQQPGWVVANRGAG